MELLLDTIFDSIVSENMPYDKSISGMYGNIIEKYKKSDSIKDEDEIFCDVVELVYYEQVKAFKAGMKLAFTMFSEISAI